MGINQHIFKSIMGAIWDHGCHEDIIKSFLTARWSLRQRQTESTSILEGTMTAYG